MNKVLCPRYAFGDKRSHGVLTILSAKVAPQMLHAVAVNFLRSGGGYVNILTTEKGIDRILQLPQSANFCFEQYDSPNVKNIMAKTDVIVYLSNTGNESDMKIMEVIPRDKPCLVNIQIDDQEDLRHMLKDFLLVISFHSIKHSPYLPDIYISGTIIPCVTIIQNREKLAKHLRFHHNVLVGLFAKYVTDGYSPDANVGNYISRVVNNVYFLRHMILEYYLNGVCKESTTTEALASCLKIMRNLTENQCDFNHKM